MAFVDSSIGSGVNFVNLTTQVGPKRANRKDDVIAVQAMLQLVFSVQTNPKLRTTANFNQIFPGVFDKNTALMIHDYQTKFLKRPKPEGFIKRAVGTKNLDRFTIVRLNGHVGLVLAVLQSPFQDSVAFLRSIAILAPFLISP